MNVFILCAGRTGSTSFIKACSHISNFTSDHESKTQALGEDRFTFPDQHIEADNRFVWELGQLDLRYGKDAFYVYLKREPKKITQSFMKRFFYPRSIIDSFADGVRKSPPQKLSRRERIRICYDYVNTVEANIELFLKDKPLKQVIELENIKSDFEVFWGNIKAEGDIKEAIQTFSIKQNASKRRPIKLLMRWRLFLLNEWKHLSLYFES